MSRSKIAKALGVVGAAFALGALAQGPASAATSSWSTSFPTLPSSVCADPVVIYQGVQATGCLAYGNGKVQGFAVGVNTSGQTNPLPGVHVGAFIFNTTATTCVATSVPNNSVRSCNGTIYSITAGTCADMLGFMTVGDRTTYTPMVRVCA
ncbi:hypothetical protein [Yinghuangia soli]|uniref:Secreted protein n=1 Tax=Yinghuangia soli TaxID=2908204 RepID=A0AA41PW17_9ACTN|nr:hypothetical protein [Yinghuangia soli]MCF2526924.1 hypothetical protein [Yinghuangia soli]